MADTGRPSEYKPTHAELVDDYLEERKDYYDTETKTYKVKIPTIEGFSVFLGVTTKTLYNWADEHPEFLHALERIKKEQQQRLLDNGLAGTYNPTIAKLVLSANHGMREKTDVTTDGKELPTPILHGVLRNDSTSQDSVAQ